MGVDVGAVLIFEFTAQAAKAHAAAFFASAMNSAYTDVRANLIRDESKVRALADPHMLRTDSPHLVDCPECCRDCGWWGCGLTESNMCQRCGAYPGDALVELLRSSKN